VSLGHETVLAKLTLFTNETNFNKENERSSNDEAEDHKEGKEMKDFKASLEYDYLEKVSDLSEECSSVAVFALLDFERPVTVVPDCRG